MSKNTGKMPTTELLRKATQYSLDAYKDEIPGALKIESKLASSTAFFLHDEDLNMDILAHRGTQQARDWIFNFSALPVRYAKRWVHGGFALAHASVWNKCKKLINPSKKLLITGHSLGGGMAELSALKMAASSGYGNITLVTFGKPNTFIKRKKRYSMEHLAGHLSIISGSDIVTRIPRFFYCPDANQMSLYLANNGEDYVNCERDFMLHDWSAKDSISDHSMDLYAKRMQPHIFMEKEKKGKKKK